MIDRIHARRAALAAQVAEAQQQYDQLEAALRTLDRQLCAIHGGLQELDALLQGTPDELRDDDTQHDQRDHAEQDEQHDQQAAHNGLPAN